MPSDVQIQESKVRISWNWKFETVFFVDWFNDQKLVFDESILLLLVGEVLMSKTCDN